MAETILWLNIDPSTVPQKQSKSTRYRLWDSPIILSRSTPGNYDVILIIVVPSEITGSGYHLWTYVNTLVSLHLGLGNNAASPRILLFKKNILIHIYVFDRQKKKERERLFHLLAHSSNASTSQGCARVKPGALSLICSLMVQWKGVK